LGAYTHNPGIHVPLKGDKWKKKKKEKVVKPEKPPPDGGFFSYRTRLTLLSLNV
jgi:hypothetical protein